LDRAGSLLKAGGRLIVTAVTVETLYEALAVLTADDNYRVEASGVQITRLRPAGTKNMFQALNPVYIIAAVKGGNHDR
jgi:precorrin-6B methylase 2